MPAATFDRHLTAAGQSQIAECPLDPYWQLLELPLEYRLAGTGFEALPDPLPDPGEVLVLLHV